MEESSKHTDRYLFSRISEGDEHAFRQIFNIYNKQLFPFITALVKSENDAREIMQEVFLKLWLQRGKLVSIDNPGGWLHTVASNVTYDHMRKQARYELQLTRLHSLQPLADNELLQKSDAKDISNLINEAVRKLPLARRQIFQMSKIEGFSRKEIADQLHISENTVRNQLVDAVAFVQEYLKNNSSVVIPLSILFVMTR